MLGISEMKWPEEGDFWSGNYRIIQTGSVNGSGGIGIILRNSVGMRMKSFLQLNERIVHYLRIHCAEDTRGKCQETKEDFN